MILALAFAVSAAVAGEKAKPPPVPTADHVRVRVGTTEQSGWPLDPAADGGYALLGDDGAIVVLALPSPDAKPEILESDAQPVTLLPSPALVAGLEHAEEGVRDRCEELLLDQGDAALPHLGVALTSASGEARRRALEILVQHPTKKLRNTIAGALGDHDERVRQVALRAYSVLKPDDLCARCTDALTDPSLLVRHEAIVRLGRTGDLHVVDPLLKHLDDCEERSLRLVTFDALRRLTGKNFGRDEEQWRNWWSNHKDELLGDDAR